MKGQLILMESQFIVITSQLIVNEDANHCAVEFMIWSQLFFIKSQPSVK